jgi:hypothetical protein
LQLNIGAKKPVDGDSVFVIGHCKYAGERPFVLLYESRRKQEVKRNLTGVRAEQISEALGGEGSFARLEIAVWGTAWFRRSSIRKIVDMSSSHLQLSSELVGSRILFTHESEEEDDAIPGNGFSLYGIPKEQAARIVSRKTDA